MVTAKDLVQRSHRAICGATERELTVPTKLRSIAIKKLKEKGYRIVGTGYDSGSTTKIWFVARGSALL